MAAAWEQYAGAPANQAATVASLTDNPNGKGLYSMTDPDGKILKIPFDKVKDAQAQHYDFAGLGEHLRYAKDAFAVTPDQGGTRPAFLPKPNASTTHPTTTIASFSQGLSKQASPIQDTQAQAKTSNPAPSDTPLWMTRTWDWMNRPVNIGHLQQSLNDAKAYADSPLPMQDIDEHGNFKPHYYLDQLHHFSAGFTADAGKAFTTPLSLGLTVAGALFANPELGAAAPRVAMLGRAGLGTVGAVFGGKAVRDQVQQGIGKRDDEDYYQYLTRTSGNASMALGGALGLGELHPVVQEVPAVTRRFVAGKAVDTVIPGDTVTPRQQYQIAKDQGVNLDLAQATNGKVAGAIKTSTKEAPLGGPVYDKTQAANAEALRTHTNDVLDKASPMQMTPEELGETVQRTLSQQRQKLRNEARDTFVTLSSEPGTVQPDAAEARSQAQQIIEGNKAYYAQYPEELQGATGQAWEKVKALANEANPLSTVHESTILDANGRPYMSETSASAPPGKSWAEMHQLRSDLAEQAQSPEVRGSKAAGWMKQLSDTVDHSMATASAGLSPEQIAKFRQANGTYAELQQTFNNPQNKLYQIVRAPDGESAAGYLSKITPEAARYISANAPELTPHLQRQAITRMLKPGEEGELDLENLPTRMKGTEKQRLNDVLTPNQVQSVENISRTSRAMKYEDNPAPSVKAGALIRDLGGIAFGAGKAILGHEALPHAVGDVGLGATKFVAPRPIARMMTNPELVDRVMTTPRWQDRWMDQGAQRMAAAGVDQLHIDQLKQTPAGRDTLMYAGSVNVDSRAMRAMTAAIATGNHSQSINSSTQGKH